jgi:hypothetical protein
MMEQIQPKLYRVVTAWRQIREDVSNTCGQ